MAKILLLHDEHNCYVELKTDLGLKPPSGTFAECSCAKLFIMRDEGWMGGKYWSQYDCSDAEKARILEKAAERKAQP